MDGLTETRRNRISVATARCGVRTPVVSIAEQGSAKEEAETGSKQAFKPVILNENCRFRGKPGLIRARLLLALRLEFTGVATLERVSIETTQRPFSTPSRSPCGDAAAS